MLQPAQTPPPDDADWNNSFGTVSQCKHVICNKQTTFLFLPAPPYRLQNEQVGHLQALPGGQGLLGCVMITNTCVHRVRCHLRFPLKVGKLDFCFDKREPTKQLRGPEPSSLRRDLGGTRGGSFPRHPRRPTCTRRSPPHRSRLFRGSRSRNLTGPWRLQLHPKTHQS